MKVFVLSALLIASFNAIQSQSVSEKVNDDFNQMDIPGKISVISTKAFNEGKAISQKFTDFYLKFSVSYGFQLGNLGTPDVTNTYPKVMNDLQFLFSNSLSFDNGVDYQYKLSQATYELGKNLDPVRYDGYTIQSLINSKPTAINCWNDNVASIRSTYDSAFKDIEAKVDSAVNHLKSSVDNSLTTIQAEVERVAGRSVAHGRDSVTNYLEANYPEILAKFTGFRDEIATDGHNTFADTVNSVNSTLVAASKEYQKIRTVIFDCINEA